MDAQRMSAARRCFEGAHEGTMSFPAIVGTLIDAGFEGYVVDYRRHRTSYFLPDGECLELEHPSSSDRVAPAFDQAAIRAQVAWAQANPPDYAYAAFSRNVMAAGCAGYVVSFPGRRVLYFGRTAETHTEHFPQQG